MQERFPFFKGMTPILPTVLTPAGEPDLDAQAKLVEYALSCGAVAIGHMGGASEYHKIDGGDRDLLLRSLVKQVAGRAKVFVGTTDVARKTALRQAEEAADQGADLIMVCSPIIGTLSKDQLLSYYIDVGKASSLPIILQDTGASTGVYSADFILEACDKVPSIGYVKSEGINCLPKSKTLTKTLGNSVQVIGGNGGYAMPTLLRLGVTAFMTGTECVDVHDDTIQAFFAGDSDLADSLYYETILSYLYFYVYNTRFFLKYMLVRRGVLSQVNPVWPDEGGDPDPFIIAEMDRTLENINRIRNKKIL